MLRFSLSLVLLLALAAPSTARADLYPYVIHGPVITGVTHEQAWVTWFTAHHQGTASGTNTCALDALTGTPNGAIPTLNLSPSAGGTAVFQSPECARNHSVHLTGLKPGTAYSFTLDMTFADKTPADGSFTPAAALPPTWWSR